MGGDHWNSDVTYDAPDGFGAFTDAYREAFSGTRNPSA